MSLPVVLTSAVSSFEEESFKKGESSLLSEEAPPSFGLKKKKNIIPGSMKSEKKTLYLVNKTIRKIHKANKIERLWNLIQKRKALYKRSLTAWQELRKRIPYLGSVKEILAKLE